MDACSRRKRTVLMGQVIYCFALTLLFLANVGEVSNPVLVFLDWTAAIFFAVVGAVAGWQTARRD